MNEYCIAIDTPLGMVEVKYNSDVVTSVRFFQEYENIDYNLPKAENALYYEITKQFKEFFSHERENFDLPHMELPQNFLGDCLLSVKNIPCGETKSYKDIAGILGKDNAPRAVGNALNRNPIPLIIPCHRVVASNGKLLGYRYGTWRKK